MCSPCSRFATTMRWFSVLTLVAGLMVYPSSKALGQSCSAGGTITITPQSATSCGTGALNGQTIDVLITVNNTSVNSGGNAAAVLKGAISATFGGDVTFVSVGGNGCVSNVSGVASCSGGVNSATITMTSGGVALPAGGSVDVATVRVMVTTAPPAGCTIRSVTATTGPSDISTQCGPDLFVTAGASGRSSYDVTECQSPTTCPGTDGVCGSRTCVANACGMSFSTAICRPSAGVCDEAERCTGSSVDCPADKFLPPTTSCNAQLCEFCSGSSASCPTADLCQPTEACRTPGFWGTHGGTEKTNSVNITSLEIAKVGSLTICGETILPTGGTDTSGDNFNNPHSPIEALCEAPGSATFQLQLVFQLTAAALNCVANGHAADCSDDPLFGPTFAACNAPAPTGICAPTTMANKAAQAACVAALNCLNNGGQPATNSTGNFFCATGTCSDNGAKCTPSDLSNCTTPSTATCNPAPNCTLQPLPGFDPPGPAGSSKACNDAIASACTIFSASCP